MKTHLTTETRNDGVYEVNFSQLVGYKINTPAYPLDYDANITVELERMQYSILGPF